LRAPGMIYVGFWSLVAFALMFSNHEKRLWGSGKTPFAFVAYPFLAMLFIVVFIAPGMGFEPLHIETLLVAGLFFGLFATASISLGRPAGARACVAPLESLDERFASGHSDQGVGTVEYVILCGILLFMFGANIATRGGGVVVKGELGVGGIGGHLIELGIAYLVIAASQRRGQRMVRAAFVLLIMWLLAINQVKYLILLPLAGATLYRWVSGQLATWKLAVLAVAVPPTLGIMVYIYFDVAAAAAGVQLTPALISELARHMLAYGVAGILGLDQLLMHSRTVAFGASGLEYALAPFVNLVRFLAGAGSYFNVINPLYLIIHPGDLIDSNVFTLFGSLLYRGGWVGAVSITLVYALVSYWIWSRWRMRESALACAAGSWWMATLLFSWFDPFFTMLSIIEIMVILSVRGRLRIPGFVRGAARSAPETISSPGY
jgi:hypothetical protein